MKAVSSPTRMSRAFASPAVSPTLSTIQLSHSLAPASIPKNRTRPLGTGAIGRAFHDREQANLDRRCFFGGLLASSENSNWVVSCATMTRLSSRLEHLTIDAFFGSPNIGFYQGHGERSLPSSGASLGSGTGRHALRLPECRSQKRRGELFLFGCWRSLRLFG